MERRHHHCNFPKMKQFCPRTASDPPQNFPAGPLTLKNLEFPFPRIAVTMCDINKISEVRDITSLQRVHLVCTRPYTESLVPQE